MSIPFDDTYTAAVLENAQDEAHREAAQVRAIGLAMAPTEGILSVDPGTLRELQGELVKTKLLLAAEGEARGHLQSRVLELDEAHREQLGLIQAQAREMREVSKEETRVLLERNAELTRARDALTEFKWEVEHAGGDALAVAVERANDAEALTHALIAEKTRLEEDLDAALEAADTAAAAAAPPPPPTHSSLSLSSSSSSSPAVQAGRELLARFRHLRSPESRVMVPLSKEQTAGELDNRQRCALAKLVGSLVRTARLHEDRPAIRWAWLHWRGHFAAGRVRTACEAALGGSIKEVARLSLEVREAQSRAEASARRLAEVQGEKSRHGDGIAALRRKSYSLGEQLQRAEAEVAERSEAASSLQRENSTLQAVQRDMANEISKLKCETEALSANMRDAKAAAAAAAGMEGQGAGERAQEEEAGVSLVAQLKEARAAAEAAWAEVNILRKQLETKRDRSETEQEEEDEDEDEEEGAATSSANKSQLRRFYERQTQRRALQGWAAKTDAAAERRARHEAVSLLCMEERLARIWQRRTDRRSLQLEEQFSGGDHHRHAAAASSSEIASLKAEKTEYVQAQVLSRYVSHHKVPLIGTFFRAWASVVRRPPPGDGADGGGLGAKAIRRRPRIRAELVDAFFVRQRKVRAFSGWRFYHDAKIEQNARTEATCELFRQTRARQFVARWHRRCTRRRRARKMQELTERALAHCDRALMTTTLRDWKSSHSRALEKRARQQRQLDDSAREAQSAAADVVALKGAIDALRRELASSKAASAEERETLGHQVEKAVVDAREQRTRASALELEDRTKSASLRMARKRCDELEAENQRMTALMKEEAERVKGEIERNRKLAVSEQQAAFEKTAELKYIGQTADMQRRLAEANTESAREAQQRRDAQVRLEEAVARLGEAEAAKGEAEQANSALREQLCKVRGPTLSQAAEGGGDGQQMGNPWDELDGCIDRLHTDLISLHNRTSQASR